ncbi:sigma-70 family RNA polymerase sigma factor [Streptomyces sp. NPDC002734]|uniref:Sigma-70 family RNA polymerase sigma factor n=1 Tax=Streptomyces pyxinicus TaxID=2970331 RepID=A0ABT2BAZ6_9ACTN|nr:sigma-70 family RNA polymerase sigma factor [Streptomyces sp. LP11]MCS0605684.1 sigma-70 family RNA polymerase sigma factor [Streptomyces sp. LP11]
MTAARFKDGQRGEVGGGEDTSPASPACFEAFARSAIPALIRVARQYVPDHTAEDVAQAALEVVLRKWDRVLTMDNPMGYAMTVAKHRSIDLWRKQRREFPVDSELLAPLLEQQSDAAANDDADARMELLALVTAMSGRAGEVLRLSLAGFTNQEIAELLGISQSTVRVLMHRARLHIVASLTPAARTREPAPPPTRRHPSKRRAS